MLAMLLCMAALVGVGYLNYEGYFGPLLCWPKAYEPVRAERILKRELAVDCFLRFMKAIEENDIQTASRLAPDIPVVTVLSTEFGGYYEFAVPPVVIDWKATWRRYVNPTQPGRVSVCFGGYGQYSLPCIAVRGGVVQPGREDTEDQDGTSPGARLFRVKDDYGDTDPELRFGWLKPFDDQVLW